MYKEVNSRWGNCKFFAKDEYVGRSLYYYGEYGPDETEKILGLANGLCLDIGANIGVISMALLRSGFSVHAFEPQPEVFKLLIENVGCAGGEFLCRNTAVGSSAGTAKMPKVQYGGKGNFGGLGIGDKSIYGSIDVGVITIDSLDYKDVGFIKIDVEGYELEVLRGARATIERCRPILYIEDDRVDKSAALRAYIVELGYTIEEHKPCLYRPQNWFGLQRNVWDKNYASHNLICRPC